MRKGITLVEAVIMVIIAGSCMVPILGTLNHGVSRANAVRLRAAMQNVAESKMNEIIDACSYTGTTPIDETLTIPYPNETYPEYSFVLSIEVNTPVNLLEYDGSGSGLDGAQEANFREVSIVVSLLETEPEIAPVCLHTMLSKPKTAGDMIYAACPGTKTIKVISPKTHTLVDTYTAPAALADINQLTGITALAAVTDYVPLHLAVHPSGEWLAIKSLAHIFLMDIRANSLTRGKIWCITNGLGILCLSPAVENSSDPGETNTRLDRGIVFRSDGKYLFFTDRTGKIHVINVPAALPGVSKWTSATPFTGENQPIGFLELCDDQNLYVGYMNSGGSNHFKTFNTYNFQEETFSQPLYTHGKKSHQRSLTSTWGGHELFQMYCGFFLGRWNKLAPTDSYYGTLSGSTYAANHDHRHNSPIVSPDNIWLMLPQATSGNQEHCGFFRIPLATSTFSENPGTWNRSAKTNSTDLLTLARHSPWSKEGILKGITSKIYFPKWSEVAAGGTGSYTGADSMPVLDLTDIPSDVNARIPEYLYVACADNSIQAIDLYGNGTGRLEESKKITLSATPVHISTTAGSDIGTVCYATATQPALIDHADDAATAMSLTTGGSNAVMAAHTLKRALIVGFKGASVSFAETTNPTNGVAVYAADTFGKTINSVSCSYALPTSFVIKAIVPMHRREGAYILFQDTTSSPNESAIIWLEESAVGGLGGNEGTVKWRVMYVWRGKLDGFPEGAPYKMALSADDTTLALFDKTTTAGNAKNVIRLYDLNNQRFPMQQGLNLVRYTSNAKDFSAPPSDSPISAKDRITRFFTTAMQQETNLAPSNYWDHQTVTTLVENKTSRVFGHLHLHSRARALGTTGVDERRYFINGLMFSKNMNWYNNFPDLWVEGISWTAGGARWDVDWPAGSYQFEHQLGDLGGGGEKNIFGYSTTAITSGGPTNSTTDTSFSSTPRVLTGGTGATWVAGDNNHFRAWRFRPQLLKEIFLDGSIWAGDPSIVADDLTLPNLVGGNEGWYDMCFHRDTGRPTLFFIDHNGSTPSTDKVYGIGLLGSMNWLAKDSIDDADIGWDMAVSPDGRRLILTCADSAYSKAYILDISYPIPFTGPMNLGTVPCTEITLASSPVAIAGRSFNSFSSQPATYSFAVVNAVNFPPNGGSYPSRKGVQTAAMGPGGIYLGGPGNQSFLFDPLVQKMTELAPYSISLSCPGLVSYDEKIYTLGGYDGSSDRAEIRVYDPKRSFAGWRDNTFKGTRYQKIQTNANANDDADRHAVCLTPYGIFAQSGYFQTATVVYNYYPHALANVVPDVVSYYPFDEPSGTTVHDYVWNRDGAANGSTFTAGGQMNNYMDFDGSSDYVSLPQGLVANMKDFTICAWVRQNSAGDWMRVFDFGQNTTTYMFLTTNNFITNRPRFAITISGNGAEETVDATTAFPSDGSWHHLAVTLSGTTLKIYYDGVLQGTNSSCALNPTSLGQTTNNWIGRSQFVSDSYLDGGVDEFHIFDRALSAAEIAGMIPSSTLVSGFNPLSGGFSTFNNISNAFDADGATISENGSVNVIDYISCDTGASYVLTGLKVWGATSDADGLRRFTVAGGSTSTGPWTDIYTQGSDIPVDSNPHDIYFSNAIPYQYYKFHNFVTTGPVDHVKIRSIQFHTGGGITFPGTFPMFGETLETRSLPAGIYDGTFVCHYSRKDRKWYLYRVGGGPASADNSLDTNDVARLDFDNPTSWSVTNLGNVPIEATRKWTAACSYGDEIFVFGGTNGSDIATCYAYNPDTGLFRQLPNLPDVGGGVKSNGMCAVPCGSVIYLFDGSNSKVVRTYRP